MPETNGSPSGYWSKASQLILVCACLLPGVGGYFVMQYRVERIESNYISRDQLAVEVQKALGVSGVQAEQLRELTEAVKANNEELASLELELKQIREEWSRYRSHR